jgi:hypothetical protein
LDPPSSRATVNVWDPVATVTDPEHEFPEFAIGSGVGFEPSTSKVQS